MKNKVFLKQFVGRNDSHGSSELGKALEEPKMIRSAHGDQQIEDFGLARLRMKSYRDPANDEIPNAGGVECHQQFDPIS